MPKSRKRGRQGVRNQSFRSYKRNPRNNRKFTLKKNNNKRLTRKANKEAKKLKAKLGMHLTRRIHELPDNHHDKERMMNIFKTEDYIYKQKHIKNYNPRDFRNMGVQVNRLMKQKFDYKTFFELMLIFWVVQDKIAKHGIRPAKKTLI